MNLAYLKPTKVKVILGSILSVVTLAIVYWYGATSVKIYCNIAPCPQPNYGLDYLLLALLPSIVVYYLFSCAVFSLKDKTMKYWSWYYLISALPMLIIYQRGSRIYVGIVTYLRYNTMPKTFEFYYLGLLATIFFVIAIFSLVHFFREIAKKEITTPPI